MKLGWAESRHEAMNAVFQRFAFGDGDASAPTAATSPPV
jgi:hypothetical protein